MLKHPDIYMIAKQIYEHKAEFSDSMPYWQGPSARCVEIPWYASRLRSVPHTRILDIGFSFTDLDSLRFLLDLKNNNIQLQAVDIINPAKILSRYPSEWHNEILSVPLFLGDIRFIDLPDDYFDVILCISTIEHIGYDNASNDDLYSAFRRQACKADVDLTRDKNIESLVLKKVFQSLKRNGTLLLSAPVGSGGPVILQDSLGLYCAQYEYNEQSWSFFSNAEGFVIADEKFFFVNENLWTALKQIRGINKIEAIHGSHSCGCGMIHLIKG